MRERKRIGILVGNRQQRRIVLQRYQNLVSNRIQVFSFIPSSINWRNKTILGLYRSNGTFWLKKFPFPHVVYNRYYDGGRSLADRIEKVIGHHHCFNHVTHFDKQTVYRFLSETHLSPYLPHTASYSNTNLRLEQFLDEYRVIYLKPRMGNRGNGVYRVALQQTGEVHVSQHHVTPMLIIRHKDELTREIGKLVGPKPYIIQQGIPAISAFDKSFDSRVLLQKDGSGDWDVTNLMSRTAHSGYFNTSVCETASPTEELLDTLLFTEQRRAVIRKLRGVGLEAARLMESVGEYHLGEISVDFLIDANLRVWIIEINGNPQRTLYKDFPDYQAVYKRPMQYAEYLLHN